MGYPDGGGLSHGGIRASLPGMDEDDRQELNRKGEQLRTIHWYDREGRPIGMGDWTALMEDIPYRIVAKTYLPSLDDPQVEVSTVWLGHDVGWLMAFIANDQDAPPIIFETMVFGDGLDLEGRRYSTEEQARAGHAEVVHEVLERVPAGWLAIDVPT